MKNIVNWFEIPVGDFDRAKNFYEKTMNVKLEVAEMMGMKMGMFPMDEGKVSGSIVQNDLIKPGMDGTLIYLNANPDLSAHLANVEKAGGKVLMPKTEISPEIGYFAIFMDSEGNKVAFHSQN